MQAFDEFREEGGAAQNKILKENAHSLKEKKQQQKVRPSLSLSLSLALSLSLSVCGV